MISRIFIRSLAAAVALTFVVGPVQAASKALGTVRSDQSFNLVSADGNRLRLQNEEALVFEDDRIETESSAVIIETARAERIALGEASSASYGNDPSPVLALESGRAAVMMAADSPLALEVSGVRIRPTKDAAQAGQQVSYFVALRPDNGAVVFNRGADIEIIHSDGAHHRVLTGTQGAFIGSDAGQDFKVRLLQDDEATDEKRRLIKTVYREVKPEYVVSEEGEFTGGTFNGWRIEEGLLQASPAADTEPVRMEIPVKDLSRDRSATQSELNETQAQAEAEGNDPEGTLWIGPHFVRARVRTNPEFGGAMEPDFPQRPENAFRARFEARSEFDSYYFDPADQAANYKEDNPNTGWYDPDQEYPNEQMLDLGVIDLQDGIFDVEIAKPADPAWTAIVGFDFTPVGAFWGAPEETFDDELIAGAPGEEGAALGEDDDIFGLLLPIGGGAIIIGGGAIAIDEATEDDSDDDDDDDDRRPPVSPVRP